LPRCSSISAAGAEEVSCFEHSSKSKPRGNPLGNAASSSKDRMSMPVSRRHTQDRDFLCSDGAAAAETRAATPIGAAHPNRALPEHCAESCPGPSGQAVLEHPTPPHEGVCGELQGQDVYPGGPRMSILDPPASAKLRLCSLHSSSTPRRSSKTLNLWKNTANGRTIVQCSFV